jgi:hypothetical protein
MLRRLACLGNFGRSSSITGRVPAYREQAVANADPGYAPVRQFGDAGHRAGALQERRIRCHQELRAGGAGLAPFRARRRAAVPANTLSDSSPTPANPGKLNFGATIGTPRIWWEVVQGHDRRRHLLHPVQGRGPGDDGSARGPDARPSRAPPPSSRRIQSGKVRPLAVMSPRRLPALPDSRRCSKTGTAVFTSAS